MKKRYEEEYTEVTTKSYRRRALDLGEVLADKKRQSHLVLAATAHFGPMRLIIDLQYALGDEKSR